MRVAGGLRQIIQAELPKQKFLINRIKADKFCFFSGFSLYVGAAIYRAPQDCNWARLLFLFGLFFFVCCGVAHEISTTRPT
jgi:hypothetical protein